VDHFGPVIIIIIIIIIIIVKYSQYLKGLFETSLCVRSSQFILAHGTLK
jgi:hypothetical protein